MLIKQILQTSYHTRKQSLYTQSLYLSLNKDRDYAIVKQEGVTGIKHKALFIIYIQIQRHLIFICM